MVNSVFSLVLHSPYTALDLSMPIAKKPITPVRSVQIPASSKRGLPETHSNTPEDVVEPIKDKCLACWSPIAPPSTSRRKTSVTPGVCDLVQLHLECLVQVGEILWEQ